MIRAKEGASMKWTKEVCSRTCKQGAVLVEGSMSASRSTEDMAKNRITKFTSAFEEKLIAGDKTSLQS